MSSANLSRVKRTSEIGGEEGGLESPPKRIRLSLDSSVFPAAPSLSRGEESLVAPPQIEKSSVAPALHGHEVSLVMSLPHGERLESSLPHGERLESSLPHGERLESSLPHGERLESSLLHRERLESSLPFGGRLESSLPLGGRLESSLHHGQRLESSLPHGVRLESSLPHGERLESSLPHGERLESSLPRESCLVAPQTGESASPKSRRMDLVTPVQPSSSSALDHNVGQMNGSRIMATGEEQKEDAAKKNRQLARMSMAAARGFGEAVSVFEDLVLRQQRQRETTVDAEEDSDASWSFVLHNKEKNYALFRWERFLCRDGERIEPNLRKLYSSKQINCLTFSWMMNSLVLEVFLGEKLPPKR